MEEKPPRDEKGRSTHPRVIVAFRRLLAYYKQQEAEGKMPPRYTERQSKILAKKAKLNPDCP